MSKHGNELSLPEMVGLFQRDLARDLSSFTEEEFETGFPDGMSLQEFTLKVNYFAGWVLSCPEGDKVVRVADLVLFLHKVSRPTDAEYFAMWGNRHPRFPHVLVARFAGVAEVAVKAVEGRAGVFSVAEPTYGGSPITGLYSVAEDGLVEKLPATPPPPKPLPSEERMETLAKAIVELSPNDKPHLAEAITKILLAEAGDEGRKHLLSQVLEIPLSQITRIPGKTPMFTVINDFGNKERWEVEETGMVYPVDE